MKILDSYQGIAKELIKESAWDRKFGQPLPTLQDVMNEAEVDDDKVIKYKKKDGEQGEMKASSAKTMPDDHPAKQAYNKMKGDDSGEKDSGGKLGGGDFERPGSDDKPDMDSNDSDDGGTPQVPKDGKAALDISNRIDDFERKGKAGLYDLLDKYDLEEDDVYDLKNIGFDFNSEGDSLDDEQMAIMQDRFNQLSTNAKKAIKAEFMSDDKQKDESFKVINGKTYIPIKESKEPTKPKVHPFKQAYKKIGGK